MLIFGYFVVRLYSNEIGLEKVIFEHQNVFFWIVKYWGTGRWGLNQTCGIIKVAITTEQSLEPPNFRKLMKSNLMILPS